ncbi:MAG: MAE_28990/MAE_18760 family HEPN-like nuclease [Planctomycetia bacterium]
MAGELNFLRHYLDGLDKQDYLLGLKAEACGDCTKQIKQFQDHFRSSNNKTHYEYTTVIISLYGYLERFIEDLISEYLSLISDHINTFAELPKSIQDKHFDLSVELVRKADSQRYADSVRPPEIIARLHACFQTPEKYELNHQAFSHHSANFRQSVVRTTFATLGISDIGQLLRQAEPFTCFLSGEDTERDLEIYLAGQDDVLFARLNDLADRRNDLAHGAPVDDILSRDLLRSYIAFIEAYSSGLALAIYESALPSLLNRAVRLGNAIEVYNSSIVCVDLPTGQITVGDTLIAKTRDQRRPFKGGRINEIQRDRTPLITVDGGPGVRVGMSVDFGVKENHEFSSVRLR